MNVHLSRCYKKYLNLSDRGGIHKVVSREDMLSKIENLNKNLKGLQEEGNTGELQNLILLGANPEARTPVLRWIYQ